MKQKIIVIVGPTAVGKSDLGIKLAEAFNGEIINGDSMQVYRHLDIGTAKVTSEEMNGITHHLLNIKEPDESFSVSDFKHAAAKKISELSVKGILPIIVGGTGLYLESLLYDVSHGGEAVPDINFREKMEQLAVTDGNHILHRLLKEKDPEAAVSIHPNNIRRVIRALEVMKQTGKTFTSLQAEKKKEPLFDSLVIGLNTERSQLYDRIEQRVERMAETGLIQEAKWLYETYDNNAQSKKGIGYKELFPYFEEKIGREEALNNIKQHSRNYAKRQLTWFRNRMEVDYWADLIDRPSDFEQIKRLVESHMESD